MTYNVFSGTLNPTHFTSLGLSLKFRLSERLSEILIQKSQVTQCLRNDPFCVKWDIKPYQ